MLSSQVISYLKTATFLIIYYFIGIAFYHYQEGKKKKERNIRYRFLDLSSFLLLFPIFIHVYMFHFILHFDTIFLINLNPTNCLSSSIFRWPINLCVRIICANIYIYMYMYKAGVWMIVRISSLFQYAPSAMGFYILQAILLECSPYFI